MSDPKTPASPVPVTADAPPQAKFEWTHSPFEAFLEKYFKHLLAVVCVAALGAGGWLVWQQRKEARLKREGQAFAGAESLEDYKKVIANFPGSTAAGSAQLMIANLLAQNNDTAGAIEELDTFASTYPTHPLVDQAVFRVAALTADKGDLKGGLEKFEAFVNTFPKSPLTPLARLRGADGLAASGDRDAATKAYEAILADNTLAGNAVRADAENRLAKVKLKPPAEVEFVPEPPPPPPATPTPGAPAAAAGAATPEINVPPLALDPPATPAAPADPSLIPNESAPADTPPTPAAPPATPPATPPPAPEK